MKRVLDFNTTERPVEFFEMLWQGFVTGGMVLGNQSKDGRTTKELKVEAGIARKLKGVSREVEAGSVAALPTGDKHRTLEELQRPADTDDATWPVLTFTQTEHDLLTKYVEVPQTWKPSVMDDVAEMWDFLSASERVEEKTT
jgi:hypothetical protein